MFNNRRKTNTNGRAIYEIILFVVHGGRWWTMSNSISALCKQMQNEMIQMAEMRNNELNIGTSWDHYSMFGHGIKNLLALYFR